MGFICNGNSCILSLSSCKNTKIKVLCFVFLGLEMHYTVKLFFPNVNILTDFLKDSRHFFNLYFNHKALTVLTNSHMWFDAVWLSCIVPNIAYPTVHVWLTMSLYSHLWNDSRTFWSGIIVLLYVWFMGVMFVIFLRSGNSTNRLN